MCRRQQEIVFLLEKFRKGGGATCIGCFVTDGTIKGRGTFLRDKVTLHRNRIKSFRSIFITLHPYVRVLTFTVFFSILTLFYIYIKHYFRGNLS